MPGIVNDDLTVRRPAYEVTVEVESRTPGAEPQRRMVVLTATARDATPTRTDSFAYLTDGASYEGIALSVSSRELCPASTGFGTVPLLVEPDVPLAGSVRYARPRYDSAMVGGEGAREVITFTLSEYSDSTLFYDENSLLSPAGLDGECFRFLANSPRVDLSGRGVFVLRRGERPSRFRHLEIHLQSPQPAERRRLRPGTDIRRPFDS